MEEIFFMTGEITSTCGLITPPHWCGLLYESV